MTATAAYRQRAYRRRRRAGSVMTRPFEVGADKLEMLIEGGWLDWDKSDDREAVTAAIEAFLAHGAADHDPGGDDIA